MTNTHPKDTHTLYNNPFKNPAAKRPYIAKHDVLCLYCKRRPADIPEYVACAIESNITPAEYVMKEEGTYNKYNGHFCCTDCYIEIGMPAHKDKQWVAP
jgi:hypothetical protein